MALGGAPKRRGILGNKVAVKSFPHGEVLVSSCLPIRLVDCCHEIPSTLAVSAKVVLLVLSHSMHFASKDVRAIELESSEDPLVCGSTSGKQSKLREAVHPRLHEW